MKFKRAAAVLSICAATLAASTQKANVDFEWGVDKIRGVNIGGWLVLEPWITPSIFDSVNQGRPQKDIVDEYTLSQHLGSDAALAILRQHWDSFVTWHDFHRIKKAGFNVVRIPIGYWAYDTFGSPYTSGAAVYIDAAVDWARLLGLKMIIDLHGVPGSQNGFDNSGQRMDSPTWQTGDTVQQTLQILQTISDKYAQPSFQDVIVGIELINEPAQYRADKLNLNVTKQFYRDGYNYVRGISNTTVIIADGFMPPNNWNGFLTPSDNNSQNVAIDHHEYQVFNDRFVKMSPSEHIRYVCTNADNYSGADKWTVIGEWTGAMTDCARYLNGYGLGARYDGTFVNSTKVGNCGWQNDIRQWTQSYKISTRKYIEAQISTFEARTQGWFWWNFKTERAAEWDAFDLIDAGIFPAIVDGEVDYRYKTNC